MQALRALDPAGRAPLQATITSGLAPDTPAHSPPNGEKTLLLLRLGLRRGEVAGLTLDDIDWRVGELVVVGKGARQERLPLPTVVSYCT